MNNTTKGVASIQRWAPVKSRVLNEDGIDAFKSLAHETKHLK